MQQLKQPIHKELPPLKVFLDEVRNIHSILAKHCRDVTIETARYEISDIDKLVDIGIEQTHQLKFKAHNPYISIELQKSGAHIFIGEDSTLSRGILNEIEEALSMCRRKVARFLSKWWFVNFVLGLIFWSSIITTIKLLEGLTVWVVCSVLAIIYIYLWVYGFRLSMYEYSTIVLSERRERKNFFVRNRDQILVNLLVAIVTAAFTLLAIKLAQ